MSEQIPVHHGTGPDALATAVAQEHVVILVDVLRASSTIITALANGAAAVIPVPTIEEAQQRASSLPDAFLAGERETHPPPGFDFGNSPQSFLTPQIRGRLIILTTSNFTRTLGHPPETATILVGGFLNIEHVAATALRLHTETNHPISIISAGSPQGPSVEDDFTADHLRIRIQFNTDPPSYADPADLARELLVTQHGSLLVQAGYEDDIQFCAQPNRYPLTPIWHQGAFYSLAALRQQDSKS
jgi:2-phosphosulfolactate phosphatase